MPPRLVFGEAERPAHAALPRRGAGIERPVGAAGGDVGLVEPLEDVIGRVRRVQVVSLIERRRLEQLGALAADVAHLQHQVLAELALHAEVVLLDVRRSQIAIDGAELERLGDVATRRQVRSPDRSGSACRRRRA